MCQDISAICTEFTLNSTAKLTVDFIGKPLLRLSGNCEIINTGSRRAL